jgi:hypothetical protein
VECPLVTAAAPYARERLAEYLVWLLGKSISMDYEDNAAAWNEGAAAELREASGTTDSAVAAQAAPVLAVPPASAADG